MTSEPGIATLLLTEKWWMEMAMLAKLVDAAIDPGRMDRAVSAVQEELIPAFLTLDGALQGLWVADGGNGRVLSITLWSDADSLRASAAADGEVRATVGERIGLRVYSVQSLPVLTSSRLSDPSFDRAEPDWIRVTWVDGVSPAMRERVPELYGSTLADQSDTAGFCGSYWLADEDSPEACAISLWDDSADPAAGAVAHGRRRRRLEKATGIRIRSVREHRIIGIARPVPDAGPTDAGTHAEPEFLRV